MADPLVTMSARALGERIRTKAVSPVEVVKAFLDRSEQLNPSLNAYITITRAHAEARAREAEQAIMAGRHLGPLHGVPYAPKDILATKGILTTNGSKVTATWVPDVESTITDRLNRAGAIMIGKLNLLEFAMGSGVVSGFGPARNPWHREYTPSGSSSGSGVALAARMVPLSIGTDTGGSIRGPAALCGVVGLKQTYGLVSRYGVTTLSWTLDHAGPMTTTVEDAALVLQVIAGADANDATCSTEPVPDYSAALRGSIKGLRVGVPTSYFFDEASPEVEKAVRDAIETLRGLGAVVVNVDVPSAHLATSAGWTVAMAEAACFHEQRLRTSPDLFDPIVRERLEAAKFYTATDYIKSLRVRSILQDEMDAVFERCDVMAVPGSLTVAGRLESAEEAATDVKAGSRATAFRRGNTFLGNMTGLPSMAIPCGFSAGPPALPISLLLYGRGFDEATLLKVGHAYQQTTNWHTRVADG